MPDLFRNPVLRDYLSSVRDWHGYVRFIGLPHLGDNPDVMIDRLFIEPQLTRRHVSADEDPDDWSEQAESAVEALASGRPLVVLGDPGSGKSTLANYLVWLLARPGRSPLVERFGWRMPVPLVLRELRLRGVTDFEALLQAFLRHEMSKPLREGSLLERSVTNGQAFIVLDGIDEVGDSKSREDLRKAVFDGFDRYPDCLWMLTSRIVGYSEAPFNRYSSERPHTSMSKMREPGKSGEYGPIVTRFIAPFDDRRIATFARKWYVQRAPNVSQAEKDAMDLTRAIRTDSSIRRLARVPSLLSLMALIHRVEATLPHGRAVLYDRISEAYLESIDKYRGIQTNALDLPQKKRWLARVGYEMQCRRTIDPGDSESAILIGSADVVRWIQDEMTRRSTPSEMSSAQEFLDFIGRRSGLFLPRGERQYAFIHLSFQEYFAAVALEFEVSGVAWARNRRTPLGLDRTTVAKWARWSVWRETLTFLFELLSIRRDWHAELLSCIFGVDFSSLREGPKGEMLNLATLLARLVTNQESGLSRRVVPQATDICVKTNLRYSEMSSDEEPHSDVLTVLLSQDEHEQRNVLRIIEENINCLKCKELDLSNTSVADLQPIENLTSLRELNLQQTLIADVSSLDRFSSLEILDIGYTRVEDLSPLSGLPSLRELYATETRISDLLPVSGMTSLTVLNIGGVQVSDLTPLASLFALERLHIWRTPVVDLGGLAGLSALVSLYMLGTKVVDLGPLADVSSLKHLDIRGTEVSDVSPLKTLDGLVNLYLEGTDVWDVSELAGLISLLYLNLGGTKVADVSGLAGLRSLEALDLGGTAVIDVAPLRDLSCLEYLDLEGTGVVDLSPLASLRSLKTLNLAGTPVGDLSPLGRLSALESLKLDRTDVVDFSTLRALEGLKTLVVGEAVSEDLIYELARALPNCTIRVRP